MTTSNSSPNASLLPATVSGNSLPRPVSPGVADTGRIRFGSGCRLPRLAAPANVADTGRIRFGSGCRIPTPQSR
jgi:hypothetical protein